MKFIIILEDGGEGGGIEKKFSYLSTKQLYLVLTHQLFYCIGFQMSLIS